MTLLHSKMVPLGSKVPFFELPGIDGKLHSLASYASKKVLVVIFMCNHCPYVQKIWDDLVALHLRMPSEVEFLGINSNGANSDYPEDSYEKMKEYAEAKGQKFPYLLDETQQVGKEFGATCTPDIFVYDSERTLAYRGAFEGLEKAVFALLKNEPISVQQNYSMGCSIKWND